MAPISSSVSVPAPSLKTVSDLDSGKASQLFITAIALSLLVIYPQFV